MIASKKGRLNVLGALLTIALAFPTDASARPGRLLAIVGATLIDVSHGGHSSRDLKDSMILMSGDRIVAVGKRRQVRLPGGTRVIDGRGRYAIPGLIDGFGSVRTRGFADAYLHEGVTTVYVPIAPPRGGIDGETVLTVPKNGLSVLTGSPISGYSLSGSVPQVHPWIRHRAQDRPLTPGALKAAVDAAADAGHRGILVGYDVWPDQLDAIVSEAHRRGLAVTVELAFTDYIHAVRAGVDAFIRNDKYQLSLSGPTAWAAYADDPIGGGGRAAFREICGNGDLDRAISRFAAEIARSHGALMPVLVMEATADDLGGPNPWTLPGAAFVKAAELDDPVDPTTGARPYLDSHPERRDAIRACARRKADIDRRLHRGGARYLVGTATPSYGVMPGSGVHEELRLLQSIGLTPREALAAATGNFAEAYRWRDRGLIEHGRRADVLLLDADPRADIAAIDSIAAVVVGGVEMDRPRLGEKE